MDVVYDWRGGDQLMVAIRNDGDEAVSDLRLRLRFKSGDNRPWSVRWGIRGYDTDGTLILEPSDLGPGERVEVLMVVPRQGTNKWFVSWIGDNGAPGQQSGEIEAG